MFIKSLYNSNILIDSNLINKKHSKNKLLEEELKKKIGNKCNNDGYVYKNSIEIVSSNFGKVYNSKIIYNIEYVVNKLYKPFHGYIFNDVFVIQKTNYAFIFTNKDNNIRIIVPYKFLKNLDIVDDLKLGTTYNVVCLDYYFNLNDKYIFIIGTLINDNIDISNYDQEQCLNFYKNIFENIEDPDLVKKSIYDFTYMNDDDDDYDNQLNIDTDSDSDIVNNFDTKSNKSNKSNENYKKNVKLANESLSEFVRTNDFTQGYYNNSNYCYFISSIQLLKIIFKDDIQNDNFNEDLRNIMTLTEITTMEDNDKEKETTRLFEIFVPQLKLTVDRQEDTQESLIKTLNILDSDNETISKMYSNFNLNDKSIDNTLLEDIHIVDDDDLDLVIGNLADFEITSNYEKDFIIKEYIYHRLFSVAPEQDADQDDIEKFELQIKNVKDLIDIDENSESITQNLVEIQAEIDKELKQVNKKVNNYNYNEQLDLVNITNFLLNNNSDIYKKLGFVKYRLEDCLNNDGNEYYKINKFQINYLLTIDEEESSVYNISKILELKTSDNENCNIYEQYLFLERTEYILLYFPRSSPEDNKNNDSIEDLTLEKEFNVLTKLTDNPEENISGHPPLAGWGQKRKYNLVSFIEHYGDSSKNGHYVNFSKKNEEEQWKIFDDLRVGIVTNEQIQKKINEENTNIVIALYKRSPLPPQPIV